MCFASALSSLCLPKLRSRTQGDQVKVDLVRIGRHVVLLHKVCSALQETFAARAALDRSTPAPIELHELAVRAAHHINLAHGRAVATLRDVMESGAWDTAGYRAVKAVT